MTNTTNQINTSPTKKEHGYQPMKPDPTSEPNATVVAIPPTEKEIGSSLVRRDEPDDED